ncbi:ferredoxin [Streptomyces sp. NPDC020141]|uniref:ferredoxin n=1 Tax=Streptomyces sp. NPDC020141 TaxID=3365065 RepID=UPI00378B1F23
MAWSVRVDPRLCLASGMCAGIAPEVFALDDDHARARVEAAEPDERLLEAADICPAQAITVHDGAEVIAPRPGP